MEKFQIGLSQNVHKFQNNVIDIEAQSYEEALEKARSMSQDELEELIDEDLWEEQDTLSLGDIKVED